jgi:putative peptide zinc metalloprotease protein
VTSCPPRLRRDLKVSEQQTASGTSFVVKDPVSRRFYRLGDAEHFIAAQFDGVTPLDTIQRRTEDEFGSSVSLETLRAFVQKLDKAGLLENGHHSRRRETGHPPKRIRGSPLYLRIALFDPDDLFTRLDRRLGFLFTPQFVAFSAACIIAAIAVTTASGGQYIHHLSRLYRLSSVPLFVWLILVIASAHEFGHGVTCKHFGGEVHELGFMLIYFQPAFYCNVSDAWMFPERAKRLWVGFAGPYFELFLWSLATLAWRVTDVDTPINYVALAVMTISGIKGLIDLNPFLKLDGYYLLSDYLRMPNLRRRSFRYVGEVLKRVFGFGHGPAPRLSWRERLIYFGYGLVGTVSSVSFLTYGVVKAGAYLIERHQPMALLLLMSYASLKARRRYRRLFGQVSDASDPLDDGGEVDITPAASASAPAEPREAPPPRPSKAPPAEPKKAKQAPRPGRKRRLLWAASAAAALGVVTLGRSDLRVGGSFAVLPEENADIRAAVEGIIDEVRVDEGQQVHAGDVIARLSDADLRAQLLQTEAQVREARANLAKLRAGATAAEIDLARAAVSKAEDQLKFAQSKLTRSTNLFQQGVVSPQELEDAQQQAAAAASDATVAHDQLKILLRGTRPEDIAATQAQVDRLEAQRTYLEQQLASLTVVSPVTGVVATPSRDLHELRGLFVARGALIAKVYAFKTVTARITIPEKEIADVAVGQPVVLRSRAYPNMTFHGVVTTIATAVDGVSSANGETAPDVTAPSSDPSVVKTFIVTTRIDNPSLLLKAGMTGQAKISCGTWPILRLIMRGLGHTFNVEFWSWW